jgi:hypothetical protein
MRVGFCLLLATCIAAGAAAGPISKFDDTAPKLEYETSRSIWDVERCLIDAEIIGLCQKVRSTRRAALIYEPALRLDRKKANQAAFGRPFHWGSRWSLARRASP